MYYTTLYMIVKSMHQCNLDCHTLHHIIPHCEMPWKHQCWYLEQSHYSDLLPHLHCTDTYLHYLLSPRSVATKLRRSRHAFWTQPLAFVWASRRFTDVQAWVSPPAERDTMWPGTVYSCGIIRYPWCRWDIAVWYHAMSCVVRQMCRIRYVCMIMYDLTAKSSCESVQGASNVRASISHHSDLFWTEILTLWIQAYSNL